jgi:hypothetical protein
MSTNTRESGHKRGPMASPDATLAFPDMRASAPPPIAKGAPPGVCGSRDAPTSSVSRFPQASAARVLVGRVCDGMEDLFLVAGLFDEHIEELLAARLVASGVATSGMRRLCDPDPALKPVIVRRR